jgi:HSP20 family molecular chaperone IbpA
MWQRAQELLQETERMRHHFFALVAGEPLPAWEPPADIFESSDALWVLIALPGVEARRIEVRCGDQRVHVLAHSDLPAGLRGARILRMELPRGRFERVIELPPGRYRLLDQGLEQGCLVLRLARVGNGG